MADEPGLGSILSGDAAGGTSPGPAAETKAEQVDSSATTAQADAPEAEPNDYDDTDPAQKTPRQRTGLRKALSEEKRKRQEAERREAELTGRLTAFQQQQGRGAAEPKKDPVDDDVAFFTKPAAAVDSRIDHRLEQERQRFVAGMRELAIAQLPDFVEKEQKFFEIAQGNPELLARLRASPNPPLFAYQTGKQLARLNGATTVEEIEARIRKEVAAELEAKHRKEGVLAAAERASTSSAGATGSSANGSGASSDDDSLGAILRQR